MHDWLPKCLGDFHIYIQHVHTFHNQQCYIPDLTHWSDHWIPSIGSPSPSESKPHSLWWPARPYTTCLSLSLPPWPLWLHPCLFSPSLTLLQLLCLLVLSWTQQSHSCLKNFPLAVPTAWTTIRPHGSLPHLLEIFQLSSHCLKLQKALLLPDFLPFFLTIFPPRRWWLYNVLCILLTCIFSISFLE